MLFRSANAAFAAANAAAGTVLGNTVNLGSNTVGLLVSNAVTLTTTTKVTDGLALINNVLGKVNLKNSPVALNPTSDGQPVGLVNGTVGTPSIVSSEIANAASGLGSTAVGTTQPMAAGDDSGGYVSNVSNASDPFADTVVVNPEF